MNRKNMMRAATLGFAGSLAMAAGVDAAPSTKPVPPNIIWIIPDDLGYGDIGCYGCKDIPTPNMDRLSAEGVRLKNFYAAAPVCSPSRACLLTGRYPTHLGIGGALMGKGGMPGDQVTVAEVLKKSGYTTGLVGKWHIGYNGDKLPNAQGFDLFYGFRGGKIDYYKHTDSAQKIKGSKLGKHDFYENEKEIFPKGYSTELFTKRAVQFVKDNKENPFFLVLAYNAPHYARPGVLQAPDEYVRRIAGDKKPTRRQTYAAMVSCMDDGIGELMAALEKNGLKDNTLVMLISDNGADPSNGGCNKPFVGGKWKYDEGGIRVPMITRWPGVIPAGKTSQEVIHMIDVFPTTLAAAGVKPPEDLSIDGLNVLDALKGKTDVPDRALLFNRGKVVIKGKWKLINGKLLDLEADPQEKNDLSTEHPEIVKSLKKFEPSKHKKSKNE